MVDRILKKGGREVAEKAIAELRDKLDYGCKSAAEDVWKVEDVFMAIAADVGVDARDKSIKVNELDEVGMEFVKFIKAAKEGSAGR